MTLTESTVLGATFAAAEPVAGFTAAGARLLERSDMGCVLINCALDMSAVISELGLAAGARFPLECGATVHTGEIRSVWLTPRSWLAHCGVDEEARLAARINDAFADKRVHAMAFGDALCWLELSGVRASELLREGGFISLERDGLAIGHAKRTLLAGVTTVVLRSRSDAWLLGIERSRARYFAEWLGAAAARRLFLNEPARSEKTAQPSLPERIRM